MGKWVQFWELLTRISTQTLQKGISRRPLSKSKMHMLPPEGSFVVVGVVKLRSPLKTTGNRCLCREATLEVNHLPLRLVCGPIKCKYVLWGKNTERLLALLRRESAIHRQAAQCPLPMSASSGLGFSVRFQRISDLEPYCDPLKEEVLGNSGFQEWF